MKLGYYPQWYLKTLSSTYKKNIRRTIVYFFIFFIFISIGIIENHNKEISMKDNMKASKIGEIDNKDITAYTYNYIYNVISKDNLKITSMSIDLDNIMLNIKIADKEDYSKSIKVLEEKFSITEVSSIIQEEEELYFRARVNINGY
ncbi:MAG: hypothetical protein ACLSV2_04375 [Clostridium sp.]